MEKQNKFLHNALLYARKGWAVLPIKPGQKKPPLFEGWETKATTDEETIREWWKKWPRANVAIRTGDDLFVVDFDEDKGGLASYEMLQAKHGFTPTMRQTTGGGTGHNFQLIYQNPAGQLAGKENVCGWAGVDTRGYHNYIVAPPSIHPDKPHRAYNWDSALRNPLDEPINPMPDWLLQALVADQNSNGDAARKPYEVPPKFQKGEQHKRLVQMAGRLRYAGAEYEEILAALTTFNETRCTEPGPPAHIAQYARSMMKYAAGSKEALSAAEQAQQEAIVLPEPRTVKEIKEAKLARPAPLIEDLIPRRGCALMVGAQRAGKTILATQLAIALTTNQSLFKNYRLHAHGPVIVFEKDDPGGDASFQDIYLKAQVPDEAQIAYYGKDDIPIPLGQAFCEWIENKVKKTGAVAVVLDSYTALRPDHKAGGDLVKEEYRTVGDLDALAKRLGCLILLLHHESITTRANGSLDWDARGAGTYGMPAAAECQILVSRYRDLGIDAPERMVRFRSRHMKEHQVTISYNAASGLFEHVLDGPAVPFYPLIWEIKRHIRDKVFTAKNLEEPLGISRAQAFRNVAVLASTGALWRAGEGAYQLAPDIERLKTAAVS